MNTYRTETESKDRTVEELERLLTKANYEIDDLKHTLKHPPFLTQLRTGAANMLPVIFIAGTLAICGAMAASFLSAESSDHARKRAFVSECITGGGSTHDVEGVAACEGGSANGHTL